MKRYSQIDPAEHNGEWGMVRDDQGQWMHYSSGFVPDEDGEPTEVSWKDLVTEIETKLIRMERVAKFARHKRNCEIDNTDFCTCGLKQVVDKVNE